MSIAFDETKVLRDVSFSVPPGHTAVFLGMSGSGKSVILKLILGLLKPDAGVISIDGTRVDTMPEARMMRVRDRIGMLFQESALFDSLTVADNVGYRMYEQSVAPPEAIRRHVSEVLDLVGIGEHIDKMPSQLSGGQRRRVAFARAIATRPQLLLLDEPTSGLDPLTAKAVCGAIIRLRDIHRVTSIIATHQLPDAFFVATHQAVARGDGDLVVPALRRAQSLTEFYVLRDGGVYFHGSAADLLATSDPYLASMLEGWIPPLAA